MKSLLGAEAIPNEWSRCSFHLMFTLDMSCDKVIYIYNYIYIIYMVYSILYPKDFFSISVRQSSFVTLHFLVNLRWFSPRGCLHGSTAGVPLWRSSRCRSRKVTSPRSGWTWGCCGRSVSLSALHGETEWDTIIYKDMMGYDGIWWDMVYYIGISFFRIFHDFLIDLTWLVNGWSSWFGVCSFREIHDWAVRAIMMISNLGQAYWWTSTCIANSWLQNHTLWWTNIAMENHNF